MGFIPHNNDFGLFNIMSSGPIQDEHNCLKHIFDQITKIHNDGGIKTNVMGPQVTL